jgi:DNA-directed RNA polymerase specialized sigma subunit
MYSYGHSGDRNVKDSARLHIMKSLERYDPEKSSINTFVFNELKRLQRIGPRQSAAIKVPESSSIDISHILNASKDLEEELGRKPTDTELSDRTKLSIKRINRLRNTYMRPAITDRSTFQVSDFTPPSESGMDFEQLWIESVYDEVDPYDKKIMEYTLGLHGNKVIPKLDIAKKLNISPSAVSQRSSKLSKKLQEGMQYAL